MKNLAPFVLSAYIIRLLITGASIGDALALIGLSALYSYFLFLESKKEIPVNKQYWDRFIELEERVKSNQENLNSLQVKNAFSVKR